MYIYTHTNMYICVYIYIVIKKRNSQICAKPLSRSLYNHQSWRGIAYGITDSTGGFRVPPSNLGTYPKQRQSWPDQSE